LFGLAALSFSLCYVIRHFLTTELLSSTKRQTYERNSSLRSDKDLGRTDSLSDCTNAARIESSRALQLSKIMLETKANMNAPGCLLKATLSQLKSRT